MSPGSVGPECHRGGMESSQVLMLHGTVAWCPDCADECVLVPTEVLGDFCCTACDAAVFVPQAVPGVTAGTSTVDRLAG